MAKVKSSYIAVGGLRKYVNQDIGERMLETGEEVFRGDILKELADHCGVTLSTMVKLERNDSVPSLVVALKISEFYQVSVNDIYHIEEQKEE